MFRRVWSKFQDSEDAETPTPTLSLHPEFPSQKGSDFPEDHAGLAPPQPLPVEPLSAHSKGFCGFVDNSSQTQQLHLPQGH